MLNFYLARNGIRSIIESFKSGVLTSVKNPDTIEYKINSDGVDLTTNFDPLIEESIRSFIHKSFPGCFVQGEEGASSGISSDFVWLIDPIDGTKYFKAGLPGFTTSVGLLYKNEPVFGYVYDYLTDCEYYGAEGQPTLRNNHEMHVIGYDIPANKIQIVVDRSQHYEGWSKDSRWVTDRVTRFINSFYRDRGYGLGALSCAMVAGGLMNMGAYISLTGELGTKYVDIAAGRALIRYAGGSEKRIPVKGLSFTHVLVAGAPHIVDKIEKIIIE